MGGMSMARVWAGVGAKLRSGLSAERGSGNGSGTGAGTWRIATANGLLLSVYLVPAWLMAVLQIHGNPARGLFSTANIAATTFAANYLHLDAEGLMRFALFVALVKVTVVLFFACFVSLSIVGDAAHSDDRDELLHIGLALASILSVASMLVAWRFGEGEAMRLHATESLMLLAAVVVAAVDTRRPRADILEQAEPSEPLVQDNKTDVAAAA